MAKAYNPYLVLAAAVLLPGMGHVLMGVTSRALMLQFFMVALGFVTWHLSSPDTSIVGRLSGGLFVYALSLPEAYRLARLRAATASGMRPAA